MVFKGKGKCLHMCLCLLTCSLWLPCYALVFSLHRICLNSRHNLSSNWATGFLQGPVTCRCSCRSFCLQILFFSPFSINFGLGYRWRICPSAVIGSVWWMYRGSLRLMPQLRSITTKVLLCFASVIDSVEWVWIPKLFIFRR